MQFPVAQILCLRPRLCSESLQHSPDTLAIPVVYHKLTLKARKVALIPHQFTSTQSKVADCNTLDTNDYLSPVAARCRLRRSHLTLLPAFLQPFTSVYYLTGVDLTLRTVPTQTDRHIDRQTHIHWSIKLR